MPVPKRAATDFSSGIKIDSHPLTWTLLVLFIIGALSGYIWYALGIWLLLAAVYFVYWIIARPAARTPRRKAAKGLDLLGGVSAAIIILLIYLALSIALNEAVLSYYGAAASTLGNSSSINFPLDVASDLPFSISIFIYLLVFRRMKPAKALPGLGFISKGGTLRLMGIGLAIFMIILAFEVLVGVISVATNVTINTNVDMVLAGAPVWFYIFSAIIEPVNEEILFRGFMVPRLGIIPSAVIFGLAHFTYNSTFGLEMVAAMIFGIMAGYVYRKTGSIYAGILAHILINSVAVLGIAGAAG